MPAGYAWSNHFDHIASTLLPQKVQTPLCCVVQRARYDHGIARLNVPDQRRWPWVRAISCSSLLCRAQATDTQSVVVTIGLDAYQIPLMTHRRAKNDRPATYLAVLDIFLRTGRNVDGGIEYLAAIGTGNARCHQHESSRAATWVKLFRLALALQVLSCERLPAGSVPCRHAAWLRAPANSLLPRQATLVWIFRDSRVSAFRAEPCDGEVVIECKDMARAMAHLARYYLEQNGLTGLYSLSAHWACNLLLVRTRPPSRQS
jgi:hypothetical protein